MMTRIPAAILALAGLASLAACGAGGSEFATKATAACVEQEGQQAAAKCSCQSRIIETALNDKEKKFVLATMSAEAMDPEAGMKALNDSGLTIADMMSMGQRMAALEGRMNTECPA
jgi:predicted small lipoprotein YifL